MLVEYRRDCNVSGACMNRFFLFCTVAGWRLTGDSSVRQEMAGLEVVACRCLGWLWLGSFVRDGLCCDKLGRYVGRCSWE